MIRPEELDARARLLRAAVGFALVPPSKPELRVLHQWLDCWRGVGDVVTGMNPARRLAALEQHRLWHVAGEFSCDS